MLSVEITFWITSPIDPNDPRIELSPEEDDDDWFCSDVVVVVFDELLFEFDPNFWKRDFSALLEFELLSSAIADGVAVATAINSTIILFAIFFM